MFFTFKLLPLGQPNLFVLKIKITQNKHQIGIFNPWSKHDWIKIGINILEYMVNELVF